ncbi:MAG: class A beta-lactamase-related serine hydrolase [Anaerolineae bacterium]|nr:class A beta-lactamase-related serine hydrolase [Anaerolineae bacterium]MCO5192043.1 class A beta-lactamase-related serine hydrolase [Anaerolineae bacterium]
MINRRKSPGLGQWLIVTFLILGVVFLLYKLYQYGQERQFYPTGLEIGGVDVGGRTRDEAEQILADIYLNSPVIVYHLDEPIEISPTQAEFSLDFEAMMSQADYQRVQQDFWAGFWGYLWGRPVDVASVELAATHNPESLADTLGIITDQMDTPALPPQPVPGTMSFQYGDTGIETNLEASLDDVTAALYRARDRKAFLVVNSEQSERPDISLLQRLITNHVQDFEAQNGGVASVFIIDLSTGEEVGYNQDLPMSGMSVLKVPILLEALRSLNTITPITETLMDETATETGNEAANELLAMIGDEDGFVGADAVTQLLTRLGLVNSFMVAPYDETPRRNKETLETPANSVLSNRLAPTAEMQTTAEDIGALFEMLYTCATADGGALRAAFSAELSQADCQEILTVLANNKIGTLVEEGVPNDVTVIHRHGWTGDTYGDASIVFSPGGDYVIVEFLHKPGWLQWEIASPLMADISRAAYNYFNFDDPYLGGVTQVN